jgi:Cu/Ag efflux protein CusF
MKARTALVAMLLSATLSPAWAEGQNTLAGMHGMDHGHGSGTTAGSASSQGVIRKIDAVAGKITLRHGELAGLGMPAMTMTFGVKDKALLRGFKAGDKVSFRVDRSTDGNMTVGAISHVK